MDRVWLTFPQAATWIGPRRAGRPTHARTVRAWCKEGLKGVKLRYSLRGGIHFTRPAWIKRFWTDLAEARETDAPPTPPRPVTKAEERRRAREWADMVRRGIV